MKITKMTLEPKDEVIGIVCDKCKKDYRDEMEIGEFLCIDFVGGFNSEFGDGLRVESDICQHCLKEWLGESFRSTDFYE